MLFVYVRLSCQSIVCYFRFRPQYVEVDEEDGDDGDVHYPDVVKGFGNSAAVEIQVAQIQNHPSELSLYKRKNYYSFKIKIIKFNCVQTTTRATRSSNADVVEANRHGISCTKLMFYTTKARPTVQLTVAEIIILQFDLIGFLFQIS